MKFGPTEQQMMQEKGLRVCGRAVQGLAGARVHAHHITSKTRMHAQIACYVQLQHARDQSSPRLLEQVHAASRRSARQPTSTLCCSVRCSDGTHLCEGSCGQQSQHSHAEELLSHFAAVEWVVWSGVTGSGAVSS